MAKTFTFEDAVKLMKKRGYELLSTVADRRIINFCKGTEHFYLDNSLMQQSIIIHAKIDLNVNDLSLSFVDLPMLMQINTGSFSITHPDFKRFEDYIIRYAQVCTKQRL